jgi:hypothetical protein
VEREERAARSLKRSGNRSEGRGAGCGGNRRRNDRQRCVEARAGRRLLRGSAKRWRRRHDAAAVIAFDPRGGAMALRWGLPVAGACRGHARAAGHRRAKRHRSSPRRDEDGQERGSKAADFARRIHCFGSNLNRLVSLSLVGSPPAPRGRVGATPNPFGGPAADTTAPASTRGRHDRPVGHHTRARNRTS